VNHGAEVGPRSAHGAVIPASRVNRAGQPRCVGAVESEDKPGAGPLVELVREDGVIRAIDVTCSCGERIRLRCTYD
jgi:hypothetical protein